MDSNSNNGGKGVLASDMTALQALKRDSEDSPILSAMNSLKSALPKNSESANTWDDPVICEVRDRLTARFGNDLDRVAQDLMERQLSHGSRLRTQPALSRREEACDRIGK